MARNLLNVFKLNPNYSRRIFGIDLIRAIAILNVLIGHGSFILDKANTDFPWIRLISGVELFFVLSGFMIGGIIIKSFEKNPEYGIKDISNFLKRRWFRTLPNYYLILIINIFLFILEL